MIWIPGSPIDTSKSNQISIEFWISFGCLLASIWTPTWLPKPLQNWSQVVLKWMFYLSMVLTWIFHRFSHPCNTGNWAPVHTRIKFCSFDTSGLKFTCWLHFGAQKVSKIEPKNLQNPFWKQLIFSLKLSEDFEPNLAPTWTQVGPMLASKIDQKSILEAQTLPVEPPGPIKIRFSRFGIDFSSIFYRFSFDFFCKLRS